jgi:hypothetical protein
MGKMYRNKATTLDYKGAERKMNGFGSVSNRSPTVKMALHVFEEFWL